MDHAALAVSKVTAPLLQEKKLRGEKITCLTAYDFATAQLVDEAGLDVVLVGDSLGTTILGYSTTLPVTLDDIIHHCKAVRRAVRRALLVVDLPFGSYHVSADQAVASGVRCLKEAGAEALKIEGGAKRSEIIHRCVEANMPVMGHIGLTPQSVLAFGGHKVQGKTAESASDLMADAVAVEDAGAFAVVLEGIPRELAAMISERLHIPTIGIGAGPSCDGQILVVNDLLGITPGPSPKFVRAYANLRETMAAAFLQFRNDVRDGRYPSDAESYHWTPAEFRRDLELQSVRTK